MLKFMASMKFGIFLMILIIITSIISTAIPIEESKSILLALQGTPKILMVILFFNLLFCTLHSLPKVWKLLQRGLETEKLNEEFFKEAKQFKAEDSKRYLEYWEEYLSHKKYKFSKKEAERVVYFTGHKNKISLLAPHFLHVGLIIVLMGGLLGAYLGAESSIAAKVGETVWVPKEVADNMFVRIDNFETLYDQKGNIANWKSDISLIINGIMAKKGSTMVNSPIKYQGVKFYQTAYEVLHKIKINVKGQSIERTIANRTFDKMTCILLGEIYFIETDKHGINLTIFKDKDNKETYSLQQGDKIPFPEGVLTYQTTEYNTILTAKKDPGTGLVMLGFLIMFISSLLFWGGRFRSVYLMLNLEDHLAKVVVSGKGKAFTDEIINDLFRKESL